MVAVVVGVEERRITVIIIFYGLCCSYKLFEDILYVFFLLMVYCSGEGLLVGVKCVDWQ